MTENPREVAKEIVGEYLDERLELADRPPGLREAVETRLVARNDQIVRRGKSQIKQLRARSHNRPHVYYAHEEVLETELQHSAAGVRAAMAMEGHIVEAIPFERAATRHLASTAAWAIRSEAARVPRPPTRPSALGWTLSPVPWLHDNDYSWPPPDVMALENVSELTGEQAARCDEEPYTNWAQLGLIERQRTYASKHPHQPARSYTIAVGIEVTEGEPAAPRLPFFGSSPAIWTRAATELVPEMSSAQAQANLSVLSRPLAGILDFDTTPGVPHPYRAPGLHPFLLAPHLELAALLRLRPEAGAGRLMLIDDKGLALVCRQWSAFPIHDGNFEPLEPAVVGTDLLLRPDLYEQVVKVVGPDRIRLGSSVQCAADEDPPPESDK